VLVADPSYGATYDLEAAFRTVRAGRSWWPPRSTVSPTATTASTWTPGGGSGFAPSLGLERLRELITSAGRDEDIEVTATSGMMPHAGELLRRAAIPSRLAAPPQGRR
jgi:hypothetical protein